MYILVLVLVPPSEQSILQTVQRLLAPYNSWIEGPERKVYLTQDAMKTLASNHNVDPTDFEQLATKARDRIGSTGGWDESGLYFIDTSNPQGMWDSWRIGGDWDGWIQGKRRNDGGDNLGPEHEQLRYNTCVVSDLPFGLDFTEIVTPDGIWHSWYIKPNRDPFRRRSERDEIGGLLKQHADHIAVCVDCHF